MPYLSGEGVVYVGLDAVGLGLLAEIAVFAEPSPFRITGGLSKHIRLHQQHAEADNVDGLWPSSLGSIGTRPRQRT